MNKKLFILFLTFLPFVSFPSTVTDTLIVDSIANILIKEYDNYKDKSFSERLVLKLGKRAFIDSVHSWQTNYADLDTMPVKLHYQLNNMAKVCDECLDTATAARFRTLLTNLTRIGYKNLDIYYRAIKKLINNQGGVLTSNITLQMIDYAVADLEFYEEKKIMYDKEQKIKDEMRAIMKMKKVKNKIGFYKFAFEFLDKIRVKIIEEDLKKIKNNMESLR